MITSDHRHKLEDNVHDKQVTLGISWKINT